jgi:hypothetical protein
MISRKESQGQRLDVGVLAFHQDANKTRFQGHKQQAARAFARRWQNELMRTVEQKKSSSVGM